MNCVQRTLRLSIDSLRCCEFEQTIVYSLFVKQDAINTNEMLSGLTINSNSESTVFRIKKINLTINSTNQQEKQFAFIRPNFDIVVFVHLKLSINVIIDLSLTISLRWCIIWTWTGSDRHRLEMGGYSYLPRAGRMDGVLFWLLGVRWYDSLRPSTCVLSWSWTDWSDNIGQYQDLTNNLQLCPVTMHHIMC